MRKNALFQGFNLCPEAVERVGLQGGSEKLGDDGHFGDEGERGGLNGAVLGAASYDSSMYDIASCLVVRIDASSSSEMPESVVRSEYELDIDPTLVKDDAEKRIVSASEPEAELTVDMVDIVDMVRSDAMLDRRSEPEFDDAVSPISCLCAPQWTSGIEV
jgi:hypothetical protein